MKRFVIAILLALVPLAMGQTAKASLADLIQAVKLDDARASLRAGADVNAAQTDGTRPIHWAVYQVDLDLVQALIAKKADVNAANVFGSTPIAEAAKLGDAKFIKTLLDAGAKTEGANPDGETPLMVAIKLGHLPVVEMLVKAGANVNVVEKTQRQTALMWAASAPKNAPEMVKILLSKGADTKPRTLFNDWDSQITSEPRAQYRPVGGLTALHYAVRDDCYFCVKAMLDAGADINVPTPEGVTALMLAIDNDHQEVAKLLLDRGANPHVWDWWGRTALYIAADTKIAAEVGRGDVFGALRKAPPAPLPANGITPVARMELINALLAKGADPNVQLNMHRPSRSGNNGRFIEPLQSTGATPLHRAALVNDLELIKALLDAGASPNLNDMGLTPFLIAAGVGSGVRFDPNRDASTQAVELMIQHGADVNAQVTGTQTYSLRISRSIATNEGASALHVAALRGNVELIRYLLAHGANTDLKDKSGRKAIDVLEEAAKKGPQAAASPAESGPSGPVPRRDPSPKEIEEIRALLVTKN